MLINCRPWHAYLLLFVIYFIIHIIQPAMDLRLPQGWNVLTVFLIEKKPKWVHPRDIVDDKHTLSSQCSSHRTYDMRNGRTFDRQPIAVASTVNYFRPMSLRVLQIIWPFIANIPGDQWVSLLRPITRLLCEPKLIAKTDLKPWQCPSCISSFQIMNSISNRLINH